MAPEDTSLPLATETPAPAVAATAPSGKSFLIKERYDIKFDQPLREFDMNGALAYKVNDRIDPRRDLFALVCGTETAPRSSFLGYVKSIDHPNIMKLVEYGSITLPNKATRSIVLIYATPQGGKILASSAGINYSSNPHKFKPIISGLLSAVEALKGYGITHRSIRASNIFYKNAEKTEVVLGDCLASFPAFYQPAIYETIESLMALPAGRGNGTDKNDVYAIGVACLCILIGKEVSEDLSLPELLRLKLKKGSYICLSKDEKIPNQYVNMIKGLLIDEPLCRWDYMQSYNFLEGKANSFVSPTSNEKPKRSITINSEKCYSSTEVSYALYNNPEEAYELIKSGKVSEWVKNGLEDDKIYASIENTIKLSHDDSTSMLIAKICVLIDHNAPIHIQKTSVFPDGAPKTIFYNLKNRLDVGDFYELFGSDLIRIWYFEQEYLRSPANAGEFKTYINRKDIGYGLDRIMYDFDEDLPCVSPLIGDEFVNTAPRILKALDANYANLKPQTLPYDKNIIAFLRCKMGKKIDGILLDLNSNKEAVQISAIIRLYTDMQNKYGPVQLTQLGKWLAAISKPIIQSYHNIKLQKALERELLKVSKEGKLVDICKILENPEARQKDKEQYQQITREINQLMSEKNKILNGGAKIDEEAQELAVRFSGMLAVLTMITSFVLNLIYWITK